MAGSFACVFTSEKRKRKKHFLIKIQRKQSKNPETETKKLNSKDQETRFTLKSFIKKEMVMVVGETSMELDQCFQMMMMKMEGVSIKEWKDIPVELLMRILSLVDDRNVIAASGVCCGWRDAISLGLTRLRLSWCNNNMNSLVLSLAPKIVKLQTLILRQDKPQLEDNAVEAIANHCHELQELDLSKSLRLTDRSLYALAHGCPNLTKLNLSGCTSFSDKAIAYLTRSCRNLKVLNLCGCVNAVSDYTLEAIGNNCNQMQSLNLGWCEKISDDGVMSLAYGCPDLRTLDLCGCVLITDESVVALADWCVHLRSLGLYYCRNITDRAMYSLAQSGVKNKQPGQWKSSAKKSKYDEEGLRSLNISQCTALTPSAVQAVCDTFPALHTCSGRHSLVMSGCLNLTSVHCACILQAHRAVVPHSAAH